MIRKPRCSLSLGILGLLLCAAPAAGQTADSTAATAKSTSSEDGWFDISGFLDKSYGFVPLVVPITEPAVGYGAAGGLVFIRKPEGGGRPDITMVGGLATENGTWGALAGDSRNWLDGRLQTLAGVLYSSVNLDYYGIGETSPLADQPLTYNLAPAGGLLQLKYQLGRSHVWAGLGYVFASTEIAFDAPATTPGLPDYRSTSDVGGLTPSLSLDTRDNIFTPIRGTYGELSAGLFDEALGSDDEFQRLQAIAMQFVPLPAGLFLGLRGQASASSEETPFYLKPFIYMRGVPALRYQGDEIAQLETELRWQCWKRISVVGFVGAGTAWTDLGGVGRTQTLAAGGPGVRYEVARRYGLHVGMDVAFGPDEPALYITFGSAWARP